MDNGGKEREEEQDGMSVHSPCKAPPSSASSLPKARLSLSLSLSQYIYILGVGASACKYNFYFILIIFMLK